MQKSVEERIKDAEGIMVEVEGVMRQVEFPSEVSNYGIPTYVEVDGVKKLNCAWLRAYGYRGEDFEPNVKVVAPPSENASPTRGQTMNETSNSDTERDGGCSPTPCSPSLPLIVGKVLFFEDGSWKAFGSVDQTICSLPEYHAQSTNSSSDE